MRTSCCLLALLASACSPEASVTVLDAGPIGECSFDSECSAGKKCDLSTHTCNIGGCGGQLLDLTYVPPNLQLVLDRSCSMRKVLATTSTSKWTAAVGALHQMLADHAADVRWGLTMFPDTVGAECSQGAIPVPIADHNAGSIVSLLTAALDVSDPNYPDFPCVTNIDTGITRAATDPALQDDARENYMMLITDGAQSATCDLGGGAAGAEATLARLHTNRGLTTFVVGFGSEVNAAELDKLATAGGAPLSGATKYYQADTVAQLDLAFQAIAAEVVSCEYAVSPAPDDLDRTYVFYNKTELVPRDATHAAGWDYDPATGKLRFYGSYCSRLQARSVTDLDVVFGCPSPPVL